MVPKVVACSCGWLFSCSKLVLIGILHQHARVGLVLFREQVYVVLDIQGGTLGFVLHRLKVEQQILLDGTRRVRLEIRVVAGIQLGSDANVVVVGDHHVDVGGPVRVAAHDAQQLRRRARGVNGVLGRLEAVEREATVGVGAELAAQVVARLVLRVVRVVLAVGARLPHVKDDVGDAGARLDVADDAVEVGQLAVGRHVLDDAGAEGAEGRLGRPKGSEDGGRGGDFAVCGLDLVVDFIDEAVGVMLIGRLFFFLIYYFS